MQEGAILKRAAIIAALVIGILLFCQSIDLVSPRICRQAQAAAYEIRAEQYTVDAAVLEDTPSLATTVAVVQPAHALNDSDFNKQWAIPMIGVPEAWQLTSGGASVVVAVLDTGIAKGHEDLVGKVIAEVNLADSPTAYDIFGHGTHIAGIIAANGDNGIGIAGVAPNVRLLSVKVADEGGRCDSSSVAKGIVWAVDHGARVINMSLITTQPSPELQDAVDYAWGKGAVMVAAAGNDLAARMAYPAGCPNCLAVAATDPSDSVAPWSVQGDWVDVAAPGVGIYSTLPFGDYGYKSGTSMAAAYVSGVAALLFSVASDHSGNGLMNDEVRQAIEVSCDELGTGSVGSGRINAFEAVNQLLASE